jgi:hypothetical protein
MRRGMATETTMDIITIGEPGCIATPGHVDLAAFTDSCKREYGEIPLEYWDEDYEPARHTWMLVTTTHDADWDEDVTIYRETFHSTPGAEPYTLMACRGYWTGPQP